MSYFEPSNTVLTVSQLNRQSKELLETYLHRVQVSGEISNLARPSSGHWYFTLKDSKAQVRCAMFRSRTQFVRFTPKEGEQVLVSASVSLYEARGDYQLIVDKMESAGEGALKMAFEQLKEKLAAEGLFDQSWKKSIPDHPKHLGVITSPTGAAVRDVITVLKRRFPSLPITIYPVQVQGDQAAGQIARAIQQANIHDMCDVLIVGRGGGSLEDLWPFNEEIVARAIFSSQIPIISAVGHEVDFSISDLVADVRAATPSAAAELVSPDRFEFLGRVEQLQRQLVRLMQNQIQQHRFHVLQLVKRLRHPKDRINEAMQRLDLAEMRLKSLMENRLQSLKHRLEIAGNRLQHQRPDKQLSLMKQQQLELNRRLVQAIQHRLQDCQQRLGRQSELLNAVSPLSTLGRGYAILTDDQGKAVRHASDVNVGDKIHATLHQGRLQCEVTDRQLADS